MGVNFSSKREELMQASQALSLMDFVRDDVHQQRKPRSLLTNKNVELDGVDVHLPKNLDSGDVYIYEYLLEHAHYRVKLHYTRADLGNVSRIRSW